MKKIDMRSNAAADAAPMVNARKLEAMEIAVMAVFFCEEHLEAHEAGVETPEDAHAQVH